MALDQLMPFITMLNKVMQPIKGFFRILPQLTQLLMSKMGPGQQYQTEPNFGNILSQAGKLGVQGSSGSSGSSGGSGGPGGNEMSDAAANIFQFISELWTASNLTSQLESLAYSASSGVGPSIIQHETEDPAYNGFMAFLNDLPMASNYTDAAAYTR